MTMLRNHQLRCVRSNVALSAVVCDPTERGPEFTGLVNLSGTGCLLETDRQLSVGDVVFVRFSLPGQAEVETTGLVARVEDTKVGVSFQNVNESVSDRIVRHVMQEDNRRRR
jgi:hypothetical protein